MNNWIIIAVAVVAAVGLGIVGLMSAPMQGPLPLVSSGTLNRVMSAYQKNVYPIEETGSTVETAPYSWMSAFAPGQVLKVEGRMLYGGHIVPYITYRALSGKYQYPFLIQFDLNGDGVFSDSESLLFTGNPSTTAPMSLSVYLKGAKSQPAQ